MKHFLVLAALLTASCVGYLYGQAMAAKQSTFYVEMPLSKVIVKIRAKNRLDALRIMTVWTEGEWNDCSPCKEATVMKYPD